MSRRRVQLEIVGGIETTSTFKEDAIITGRLLGAVTILEATKIIQNEMVASRIATKETVPLKDALKALEKIGTDPNADRKDKFGRLLIALHSIQPETSSNETIALSRQLYLTPPVTLVAEVAEDKGLTSASLWVKESDPQSDATDNMVVIEEKEIE